MTDAGIDALEDAFHRSPRCAVHAEREARRTPCARCGSYACEACFGREGETLCAACRERVGETLAWERDDAGGVLSRAWGTIVQLVPAPYTSMAGVREGRGLWSALAFGALANLVSFGLPMLVCAPCSLGALALIGADAPRDGLDPAMLLAGTACGLTLAPVVVTFFNLVATSIIGLLYHLAARLAGGRGSLESSLRASSFLNALAPVSAVVWLLGRIPILGVLFALGGFVGTLVWQTFALAGHAHAVHEIRDQRAWLVAAMPALAFVAFLAALFFGLIALALFAFAEAGTFDH